MDNYSYNSYPESGDSSPRGSRDIEFENPSQWENNNEGNQNQPTLQNYKVKFMCSYNGKIHPRPHDNQLSYVGGETKILSVDRSIKFPQLLSKLIAMCDNDNISFKYQLPGEDLDALISVTCDDDLEHMMHEYDRLYKISPKPARLRIFMFPSLSQNPSLNSVRSFGSEEGSKSEKERFVDALNSAPILPQQPVSPAGAPAAVQIQAGNADFLFGSEKAGLGMGLGLDQAPDPIQKHIQDLERLRLEEQQQQSITNNYRRKSDDSFENEYYRVPEKLIAQQQQQQVPVSNNAYSQIPVGAGYPVSNEQQVYMIPAQGGGYHAPQMVRQVAGAPSQGYYTIQRMPQDYYREQQLQQQQQQQVQQQVQQQQQQMYGMMQQSPSAVQSMAAAPPSLQPQAVAATAGYSDYGMVRPSAGVGMVTESGYAQMAYDGGMGRQVIYTTQQGAVMGAPAGVGVQPGTVAGQYPTMGGAGLGPEKVVVKATQPSL